MPTSTEAAPRSSRSTWRAAIAGLLSYGVAQLPQPIGGVALDWGAGLLFGLLVLVSRSRSPGRRLSLVLASTLVYRAAVWLAVALATEASWSEVSACSLAGTLAAPLLALAGQLLLAERPRLGPALSTALPGVAGGALIGVAMSLGDGLPLHLLLLAGFVVWQVGWVLAERRSPAA